MIKLHNLDWYQVLFCSFLLKTRLFKGVEGGFSSSRVLAYYKNRQ